jgi:hypothetical protein
VATPTTPAYGNQQIADKVADIGQRAQAFRQNVQASNIQAQTARVPGLTGDPAGPTSSLANRAAGASIQPTGPVSQIPSIQPQTVSTADMARAAPDSALARRVPGAAFDTAVPAGNLPPEQLARANYQLGRVAGTNPTVNAPAQPSFGGATSAAPAAEAAAPAAADVAGVAGDAAAAGRGAGALGRVASIARGGLGAVARGAGYLAAFGEAAQATGDVARGQYGDATKNGLLATADTLATRAPTPWTIGAAIAGHAADAAVNTGPGQYVTRGIANVLPGSGANNIDQQITDFKANIADRQSRGLPIPADSDQQLAKLQQMQAGVRGTAPAGYGAVADLVSPGATDRAQAAAAASIAPPQQSAQQAGSPSLTATANRQRNTGLIGPYDNGQVTPPGADGTPPRTGGDIAQNSNLPGTAVINGRVLSPKEIADAGNRLNTVSSTAFTNAPTGVLFSAANGGIAPTSEQAAAINANLGRGGAGANGGGKMFGDPAALERSQIIDELRQQQAARTKSMNRLTSASEAALAQGRKRAAGVLANLAGQYAGGQPDYAAYLPPQARPSTPGEQVLEAAQAQDYMARAADTQEQVGRRQQIASITQQIGQESNPRKRAGLEAQLNALNGRTENNRAYTIKQPSNDVDANGSPINYELLVSPDGQVLYDPRGTMTGKNVNSKPSINGNLKANQ